MNKVVYIISDINKAYAFEWIANSINKEKFLLSFIILNPEISDLEKYLRGKSFEVQRIRCRGKSDWPTAIIKVYKILKIIKPSVVHCHLFQANIIGLIAAKLACVNKRIYTRHHSSLHHIYHPKGIWWDKLSNKLATNIISISSIVNEILINWEGTDSSKVKLIPHGFDLLALEQVDEIRIKSFKERNEINYRKPTIGVISRFTEWKGIQFIIPAFRKLLEIYPNALLLLLNARGDYEDTIKQLLNTLPAESYRLIKFEIDIAAAYKSMDLFVHVPIDEHSEAFGQTYVEALALKVPSVFTLSGIASDFIRNELNAYVVPFKDSEAIYNKIINILIDREKALCIAEQGAKDVHKQFSLEVMIHSLEELYDSK